MDGEHAFSAALVLVMINVAFPFNAEDAAAMEAALELLREMAERGNSHIRARHLLLMDLRSVIGQVPLHQPSPYFVDEQDTSLGKYAHGPPIPNLEYLVMPNPYFDATTDLSGTLFAFDATEDVWLWDEVSGNIAMGMDIDWIESARSLRTESGNYSLDLQTRNLMKGDATTHLIQSNPHS